MRERLRFRVRVTPRAGVDAVDGTDELGRLHVRVRAVPADGAANTAVLVTVARALDLAPSRLRLVAGTGGRLKLIEIVDTPASALLQHWPQLTLLPAGSARQGRGLAR